LLSNTKGFYAFEEHAGKFMLSLRFFLHSILLNLKIILSVLKKFGTHFKQKKTMVDHISLSSLVSEFLLIYFY